MVLIFFISLATILFTVLLINDFNRKKLLITEMNNKQERIEKLNRQFINLNNTLCTLIDVMPIGVIVIDSNGEIVLNNTASENILGGSASKIGGKISRLGDKAYSVHKLDGTEISSRELPYWKTIEKGKIIKDKKIAIHRKDGKEKIILLSSTPVCDNRGNVMNAVIVFKDITHLKIIEQTLHEGRKINEAFLNGITEILILIDKNGTILSLNETCAKELGLSVNEANGLNIFDLIPLELRDSLKKKLDESNNLKEQISFEQKVLKRYFDVILYPICDNCFYEEKIVVFVKEITKLKEAQESKNQFIKELSNEREKLEEKNYKLTLLSKQHMTTLGILYNKNEELKVANEAKNSFIANVSHELKTPLNITMTYLEYVLEEQDGKLNKGQKEMIRVAYSNADRLQYLINDLLDISLIESNRIKFNFESINLKVFLNTLIADRRLIMRQKNIDLKLYVPEKDIFVVTDILRFRQVIDNIIDNAIKFSTKGNIEVMLKEKENNIEVHIKDNGIGIDPNKINNIFKAFYQADDSSKKKYKGVGLGLYIAKRIIRAMGGEITAQNNIHKGCCFIVVIPYDCYKKL